MARHAHGFVVGMRDHQQRSFGKPLVVASLRHCSKVETGPVS